MIKENKKGIINADIYSKLYKLFEYKGWDIEKEFNNGIFNRYCRTLEHLNYEQQNFLIELSKDFLHISGDCYTEQLIPALINLINDYPNCNFYFACCLPENEQGNIKSSTIVLYKFKGTTLRQKVDFKTTSISVIENYTRLKSITSFQNKLIVLVDDFIGTGKTARDAISYVRKELPSLNDNTQIVVLSIVAQEDGISLLSSLGVKTYTTHIVKKGISDKYNGDDLLDARNKMNAIESQLNKLRPEFKYGYEQSEALVCMERCPNNTFPIYWFTKNNAPYER